MDSIKQQVARAWRRLCISRFLVALAWCLLATLMVALAGLLVPKIWPLGVQPSSWAGIWLGGAVALALLAALVWTWRTGHRRLDAAVEIDRRFGLKERISSALSLDPEQQQTEIGQALVQDAVRQAERIDVADRFPVRMDWQALLPAVPALAIVVVLLLPDAARNEQKQPQREPVAVQQQIKTAQQQLKKKIEQQRKAAQESGLKEAEAVFEQLEGRLEALARTERTDRKTALVKLNDLNEQVEQRRKQLGNSDQLRRHLQQLKPPGGPAEKAIRALQAGQLKQAMQEIKRLRDQIAEGKLDEQQRRQLAEQLQKLSEELDQMARAHQQAKRELEQQIRQAEKAGDPIKKAQLLQKLEQLQEQDHQMARFRQMAQQLGQCAQCLQAGGGQGADKNQLARAAAAVDQLMEQLQQMQQEMDEMEALDEMMDAIAEAKNAMNCDKCGGLGCGACQGDKVGGLPKLGLGAGRGVGPRPEQKTDTGHYWSKVEGQPRKGQVVRVGDAGGPNVAGQTKAKVRQQISNSLSEPADPVTSQRLQRTQREHAREYFENFRSGR